MRFKVLHLIDSLEFGGAQTVVKNIFENQSHNDLFLLALRTTRPRIAITHSNIIIYQSQAKYSFLPLFKIKKIIQRENITLLHCHLFRSQVFGFLLKVLFFPKLKLIFHEHGQILGPDNQSWLENKIFLYFLKYTKSKVNLFIAVSNTISNMLIAKGKIHADKIITLYNPVKLNLKNYPVSEEDEKQLKRLNGITETRFLVGFVGRLVSIKGIDLYLNVARILLEKYDNLLFAIAGDGPEKSRILSLINQINHHAEKIYFLGYIQNIVPFYSKLDCLVVPSTKEAMGLVVVEAQVMGIPVIASNLEVFNELIIDEHNGILFESQNSYNLASKIELLYSNKKLGNNIIKNAQLSAQQFDIAKYLLRLELIYLQLMENVK